MIYEQVIFKLVYSAIEIGWNLAYGNLDGTKIAIILSNMFLKGYPLEAKTAPKN